MTADADVRELLDQLDQAHAAGTPGPWRQDDQFPQYFGAEDRGGLGETRRDADAALIVAAVNALPQLTAALGAVSDLHRRGDHFPTMCRGCHERWPCATSSAITAALTGEE